MARRHGLFADTRGAQLVEYLLVLGMCALLVFAGARAFGGKLGGLVSSQAERVERLEGSGSTPLGPTRDVAAQAIAKDPGVETKAAAQALVPGTFEELQASVAAVTTPKSSADGASLCFGNTCIGGMCFRAGTPVVTADGPRAIEEIRRGDVVLSRDDRTGEAGWQRVSRTFVTPERAILELDLEAEDGTLDTLGVTPAHPFWIRGRGWVAAGELEIGDEASDASGAPVRVARLAPLEGTTTVYNLEVERFHTYFVGDLATWVHNDCGPEKITGSGDLATVETERGGGLKVEIRKHGSLEVEVIVSSPKAGTKLPPFKLAFTGEIAPKVVKTTDSATFISFDGGKTPHLMVRSELRTPGDGLAWADRLVPYMNGPDQLVLKKLPPEIKTQVVVVAGSGMEPKEVWWLTPLPPADYILEPTWKYENIGGGKIQGWRRKDGKFVSNGFYNNVTSARITATLFQTYAADWVRATPFLGNLVMIGEALGGEEITGKSMTPKERAIHGTIAAVMLLVDAAPIALEANAAKRVTIAEIRAATGLSEQEAKALLSAAKTITPEEKAFLKQAQAELRAGKEIDLKRLGAILGRLEGASKIAGFAGAEEVRMYARAAASRAEALVQEAKAVREALRDQGLVLDQGRFLPPKPPTGTAEEQLAAQVKAWRSAQAFDAMKLADEAAELAKDAADLLKRAKTPEALQAAEQALIKSRQLADAARAQRDLSAKAWQTVEAPNAQRWANELAETAPKPDADTLAKETQRYLERQAQVRSNYEKVMKGEMEPPPGVSRERLKLAVEGDPTTGQRVPLTFKSAEEFQQFQKELREIFESEGITDATVQQVGSATTGWRGNPLKEIAPWKPASDADFAIFSPEALAQAKAVDAPVNSKIVQGGKYTVLKNGGEDGAKGFADTPLGKKLQDFSRRWNERVYGDANVDGFDFKLNLSDKPFEKAPAVLRLERPKPLLPPERPGNTRATLIDGRETNKYLGVRVEEPGMAGAVSEPTPGRREFHVTVITPPEWEALPAAAKAELAKGVDIPGMPMGKGLVRGEIAGKPAWTMQLDWPEAQAFRARYGLPAKDFHVSLNGGVGDAVKLREAGGASGVRPP